MAANSPHPQTFNGLHGPQTRIGSGHKMSAVSPRAGIVHAHEPATNRHWPRISTGNESSASLHCRLHFAADQFPGSHSNRFHLCPHLTQPQFARRSRNSRRAVRRSSRICSRQRMSSRSCDRNARRIVPSPTCSRSIACRPARLPSPYSAIKCSVKPFGHANGQDESGQPLPRQRMAARQPLIQCRHQKPAYRQNRPLTPTATKLRRLAHAAHASRKCGCSNTKPHETSGPHPQRQRWCW